MGCPDKSDCATFRRKVVGVLLIRFTAKQNAAGPGNGLREILLVFVTNPLIAFAIWIGDKAIENTSVFII